MAEEYLVLSKNTFVHTRPVRPQTRRSASFGGDLSTPSSFDRQPPTLYHLQDVEADIKNVATRRSDASASTMFSEEGTTKMHKLPSGRRFSVTSFYPPDESDSGRFGSLPTQGSSARVHSFSSAGSMESFQGNYGKRPTLESIGELVADFEDVLLTQNDWKCQDYQFQQEVPRDTRTTVMVKNIPCRYTQQELVDEIIDFGLPINFLYLPPARRSPGNLGYAFINFVNPAHAWMFIQMFRGHSFRCQPNSKKRADPTYATLQGFEENVRFYSKLKVSKTKHRPYIDYNTEPASDSTAIQFY